MARRRYARGRFRNARRARMAVPGPGGRPIYTPLRRLTASGPKLFKLVYRLPPGSISTVGTGTVLQQTIFCNDPSGATDWSPVATLYDLYKVKYMKVQYYPTFNVASTSGGTAFHPIYVSYDPDSSTAVGSVDSNLQYDNCKVFNLYRPWTYKVRPQVQTDNSVNNAGMALAFRRGTGPMLDVANPGYYHKGIVQWYADQLGGIASINYGDIVITYYVLAAERR